MGVPARLWQALSARDPGRARLKSAIAMSAGVLASALFTSGVIQVVHADTALLATGVFLSVQAGIVVTGPTARSRMVTAGLLIPAVLLAVSVAALISWRPAAIVVFVLLTGAAVWVRRFGPRATAIGTMSFLAYFFTLFVHPAAAEFPVYCVIAASAAAAQLVAQVALWATSRHPERELAVLLTELRIASTAALQDAMSPERTRTLRMRLADVDAIGHAVTSWQQRFRTSEHIDCDEETLAARVLDARVDLEEVCLDLTRTEAAGRHGDIAAQAHSLEHLRAVLDEHASPDQLTEAISWAEHAVARAPDSAGGGLTGAVARSILAQSRLRSIDLHRVRSTRASADPPPPGRHRPTTDPHERKARRRSWREWAPTSRLAVQAMIAAAIAAAAGESISASRWYWAVLTAFLIFVSTTTRSGILTRAYHRVAGTAIGVFVGIGAAFLAHDNRGVLIAICVVSVFGMIYLGLLNYMYSPLFTTILVVTVYEMLGVLHGSILELRITETIAGGVIGVLCAYLILSSNSHPALVAKVNAYFDALDELLQQASSSAAATDRSILARIQALEEAQAAVDQTVSAMSAAFLLGRHEREEAAVHLMYVATRSAVRFAQVSMTVSPTAEPSPERSSVQDAVADARAAAARVRHEMDGADDSVSLTEKPPSDLPAAARFSGGSVEPAALVALDRLRWALTQLSEVVAPRSRAAG